METVSERKSLAGELLSTLPHHLLLRFALTTTPDEEWFVSEIISAPGLTGGLPEHLIHLHASIWRARDIRVHEFQVKRLEGQRDSVSALSAVVGEWQTRAVKDDTLYKLWTTPDPVVAIRGCGRNKGNPHFEVIDWWSPQLLLYLGILVGRIDHAYADVSKSAHSIGRPDAGLLKDALKHLNRRFSALVATAPRS